MNRKYRKEVYKSGELISVFDNRELEEEKIKKIKELKAYAYEILSESDWEIVKASELQKQPPKSIIDKRKEIRLKSNEIEKLIENSSSLAELDIIPWHKELKIGDKNQ